MSIPKSSRLQLSEAQTIKLKSITTYSELRDLAFEILKTLPKPIGEVCGPISTGGLGAIEKNLKVFNDTIQKLVDSGLTIFDQVPFEETFQRIKNNSVGTNEEKNNLLLKEFYEPIFASGVIDTVYFISNWESSQGAKWERTQALKYNIKIVDLSVDFLNTYSQQ